MAPPARSLRIRQAPALAVFLFVALGFGIAAALLLGPATPPSGGTSDLGPISYSEAGILAIVLVAVIFGGFFFANRGDGRIPMGPAVVVFAGVFVVLVVLLILTPFAHSSGTMTPVTPQPPGNITPPNGTPPPTNGPSIGIPSFASPWTPWVIVGITVVVVALVVVPMLLYRLRTEAEPQEDDVTRRRAELLSALHALDARPEADPRQRIIALYGQLLARVAPKIDLLDSLTAREVARAVLREWRVPEKAAQTLTDLFEEARYSQHTMTEASVERARSALTETLAAIDRPRVAL